MIPWSTMNYGNYGNYGRYVDAWGWKPLMYPEWEWWPNNYGNKKGVETNFWKGTDGVFWTNLFCLILIVNFPMLEKTVHAPRSFTICFALPGSSYRHTTRPAVQIQWPFQHFRGGIWHEIASAKCWKMLIIQESMENISSDVATFWRTKKKMFVNLQQPQWYLFGGCLCCYKSLLYHSGWCFLPL